MSEASVTDASSDPPLAHQDAASTRHLLTRLAIVETRVRRLLADLRRDDPTADDPDRGLVRSRPLVEQLLRRGAAVPLPPDAASERQLADLQAEADAQQAAGTLVRLPRLRRVFGLSHLDEELLLVAAAPALDPRFEAFYAYLNDDVGRRQVTVGLALRLCGVAASSADGRARLGPRGPLVDSGLVEVTAGHRPLLSRELQVPDRVVAHLIGDDTPHPAVAALKVPTPPLPGPAADRIRRALADGLPLVSLRDVHAAGGAASAVAALSAAGGQALTLDLDRLAADDDVEVVARAAQREARLLGAGLVIGPLEALTARGATAVRAFAERPAPTVIVGRQGWDPVWSRTVPAYVDADRVTPEATAAAWRDRLGDDLGDGDTDHVATVGLFRLTPEQIDRATAAARQQAVVEGRAIATADLQRGARSQNAAGLEHLAQRVEPTAGFADLVLPDDVEQELTQLVVRWRHRDQVLGAWRLGGSGARGRGVSALFAGESGTGKTMAAEALANELGLDLYIVELSTVVDKYIGETSKNLERIFTEAARVNGVLLFDEADALFGKRSQVSDSKDRHANLEVAHLLQRMEAFDGVAILTTNLAANLDEAFTRRLDAIIDFPMPDQYLRHVLWRTKLRSEVPQVVDLDLRFLANTFRVSGSEIQNIVVSAAYRAAAETREVTMADLVWATVREHRKVGRHLSPSDLGPYLDLVTDDPDTP